MGLVSLFTSCVDGDYYDLYDEEEELLSPRSKKGKDVIDVDFSKYPMMNDGDSEYNGWYRAECVACCYANFYTNGDKAASRYAVIVAQYGKFTKKTYKQYFKEVQNAGGNLPGASAQNILFGSGNELNVESFARMVVNNHVMSCQGSHLALYSDNYRHIAMVNYVHTYNQTDGGYYLYFDVSDQYTNPQTYYVKLDSALNLTETNIQAFRMCR